MDHWVAPDVRLIQADNPGPLTGTGTNTWMVGTGSVAIIDPGPKSDEHLEAILGALMPDERISHILVTHTHLDHSALAPDLQQRTNAVTVGFGSACMGRTATMQRLASAGLRDGGEGIDTLFQPAHKMQDGDTVSSGNWELRAIHTPGHAATHLCFAFGNRLFSGDHVMGWSSSLVSPPDGDMAAYMASLDRLAMQDWHVGYPGHGPIITNPNARIAALLAHRRQREAALLAALGREPVGLQALTAAVYSDVPLAMHRAASRNVLAHVIDLHERNLIICDDLCADDPFIAKR